MNETLINLLSQNSAEKIGGKKEEGRRYNLVQLSVKKYFRRSSSQVHRGNATIWPNHQMMIAETKEMMLRPAKIRRILWIELTEKCAVGFSAIYPLNISAQSSMTRTKRETAKTYLEPCQTSRIKLFAKILNCVHPQTIVFIVLTSFYQCVFRTQSNI